MKLANFNRVLEENKATIGYHQVWRYTKAGKLPRLITWLAERPALAAALAADAAELAAEQTGQGSVAQQRAA